MALLCDIYINVELRTVYVHVWVKEEAVSVPPTDIQVGNTIGVRKIPNYLISNGL